MSRNSKIQWLLCCSMGALLISGVPGQNRAYAAAEKAVATGGLEEIVVTARKREESVQKAALSITAISTQDLKNQQITRLEDLKSASPGLAISSIGYDNFSLVASIRGQGQSDVLLPIQPAVAINIDGVYYQLANSAMLSNMLGIDHVEILKGPQGTLYGRNTTGGAVNVFTKTPSDKMEGIIQGTFGNRGTKEVSAYFNAPLIEGKLAANISAQYHDDDGFGRDTLHNTNLMDKKSRGVRAAFKFTASDKFDVVVRGDFNYEKTGGTVTQLDLITPSSALLVNRVVQLRGAGAFVDPNLGTYIGQALAEYQGLITQYRADPYHHPYYSVGYGYVRTSGAVVTGTYQINDDTSLKSITGLRLYERQASQDQAGTPDVGIVEDLMRAYQHEVSEELNLGGRALDQRLKYTIGGFYYYATGSDHTFFRALPFINPNNPSYTIAQVQDESKAIYGQATYSLTDNLSVTGGLRYTSESIDHYAGNGYRSPTGFVCQIPASALVAGRPCTGLFKTSFTNVSYTAGLEWTPVEDVLLYFKTDRGFKAGGTNERGSDVTEAFKPFAPEIATQYEIGAKTEFLEHKLRMNIAAYHTDYSNIQRTTIVATSGGSGVTSNITNAASAKINGFEADVTAQPTPELMLHGSLAYTKPKYDSYISGGVDLSNARFSRVPNWQYTLSAAYTIPTSIGDLRTQVDWTYQSVMDLQPDSHTAYSASQGFGLVPGYGLVNARMSLNIDSVDMEVAVYGKNLANKAYPISAVDVSQSLGFAYYTYGALRTFGAQLTKHF